MPMATIDYPMDIVGKNSNGGWHKAGKRPYRTAVQSLLACLQTYKEARLYHLCFEGQTHAVQMRMLKALVQMAHRKGIRCEWWACRELADLTKKAHIHAFMLIDAHDINPWSIFNQFDDGPVAELCATHGVNFSIFSPKDEKGIHNDQTYMHLPYQGPGNKQTQQGTARLADALIWLTYLYKARSKPKASEADGQLFPASRPNRQCKTLDASPLADWSAPVQEQQGEDMTPAEKYVATKYETGVDLGLDVEALRLYLLAHGIRRTPAQVTHDLDETYGFYGYANSHPAPPMLDQGAFDRLIMRTDYDKLKHLPLEAWRHQPIEEAGSELVPYEPPWKRLSYIDQKILDTTYELAHNSSTIFRPSGEQK